MKEINPLVSVLMTAYNREQYIEEAIESVLASTYSNFELIIVDDASNDNTASIAQSYTTKDTRVKVFVNEQNLGDYPNRNKAASYAKGKYIKYLDSDDIMYSHCLQVMVSAMEVFPEAGFGLSSIGSAFYPYPHCISPYEIYIEHFQSFGHFNRAPGSAIIKKSAFHTVGGFSGKRMIGDYELWFSLSRYFPLVKFPRDLVWDRNHDGQESNSNYAKNYNQLRALVLNEALSHSDCPLTPTEINQILKKRKLATIKKTLKGFLRF